MGESTKVIGRKPLFMACILLVCSIMEPGEVMAVLFVDDFELGNLCLWGASTTPIDRLGIPAWSVEGGVQLVAMSQHDCGVTEMLDEKDADGLPVGPLESVITWQSGRRARVRFDPSGAPIGVVLDDTSFRLDLDWTHPDLLGIGIQDQTYGFVAGGEIPLGGDLKKAPLVQGPSKRHLQGKESKEVAGRLVPVNVTWCGAPVEADVRATFRSSQGDPEGPKHGVAQASRVSVGSYELELPEPVPHIPDWQDVCANHYLTFSQFACFKLMDAVGSVGPGVLVSACLGAAVLADVATVPIPGDAIPIAAACELGLNALLLTCVLNTAGSCSGSGPGESILVGDSIDVSIEAVGGDRPPIAVERAFSFFDPDWESVNIELEPDCPQVESTRLVPPSTPLACFPTSNVWTRYCPGLPPEVTFIEDGFGQLVLFANDDEFILVDGESRDWRRSFSGLDIGPQLVVSWQVRGSVESEVMEESGFIRQTNDAGEVTYQQLWDDSLDLGSGLLVYSYSQTETILDVPCPNATMGFTEVSESVQGILNVALQSEARMSSRRDAIPSPHIGDPALAWTSWRYLCCPGLVACF